MYPLGRCAPSLCAHGAIMSNKASEASGNNNVLVVVHMYYSGWYRKKRVSEANGRRYFADPYGGVLVQMYYSHPFRKLCQILTG